MSRAFAQSTLASELAVEEADEDELYAALDWLLGRQQRIERASTSRAPSRSADGAPASATSRGTRLA